ncbi:MAG: TIGR00730 family Rossman fold protein [Muribaculaceae bacterium]|nr:TIGR00730 family Rossman fold protein [Muribaculaceae bacterium]
MKDLSAKSVTVYCGSSTTIAPRFLAAGAELGRRLAEAGATVITGAGYTGMMGAVADAAMEAGGRVVGVIPQFMVDRGWHHRSLSTLEITEDMHARKSRMAALSTAAVALPGGIGTFEELTEIITWRQLGLYHGNVVICNIDGYYDPLLAMMDRAVAENFLPADHRALYSVATSAEEACRMALADSELPELSRKL